MDKLADWKRALAASGLNAGFGYSDAPWPILFALIVFIVMLLPFIVYWQEPDPKQLKGQGVNRQLLMQQLMQERQTGRPRVYAGQ